MSYFEENINEKIKKYFEKEKFLNKSKFIQFLTLTDLLEVFDLEENQELLWKEIMVFSNNSDEVNYKDCIEAIKCFFEYYTESPENNQPKPFHNKSISEVNKEMLEEIFNRLSLTIEKKEEIEDSFNETNEGINKCNLKDKNTLKSLKIEQLYELKKLFKLLDLRGKDYIYISDVQEVVKKYKFIKLNQNELLFFLSQFSIKDNIDGKLIINYEKYSNVISKIEKQILSRNNSYFEFTNDGDQSITLKEKLKPVELIEDVINIENECNELISILREISKQILNSYIKNMQDTLDNLNVNDFHTINNFKDTFQLSFDDSKNRIKDLEFFILTLHREFLKRGTKLHLIKDSIQYNETKLSNLEQDYNDIFEKFRKNQNININYELEKKLIEENNSLNTMIEEKNNEIENINLELSEKDKLNSQLLDQVYELTQINKITNEEIQPLNKRYTELKKNYDLLLDEIFEKQEKTALEQQKNAQIQIKKVKEILSPELNEQIKRELTLNKDNITRMLEFNYENLVMYTLAVEKENKRINDNKYLNEIKITDLEKSVDSLNKSLIDSKNQISKLKKENMQLLSKISDLNHNNEINSQFRPSKILSNIFRSSDLTSINQNNRSLEFSSINTNNNTFVYQNNHKKLEKIPEEANENKSINTLAELRLSNLNDIDYDSNRKFDRGESICEINEVSEIERDDNKKNKPIFDSSNIFESTPQRNISVKSNEFSSALNKENKNFTPREFIFQNDKCIETEDSQNNPFNISNSDIENKDHQIKINNDEDKVEKLKKSKINSEIFIETKASEIVISPRPLTTINYSKINDAINQIEIKPNIINTANEDDSNTVDKAFKKRYEYMCFDFQSLRKNISIIQYLEANCEDVCSYEMFSDKVSLIDENTKKSPKLIFITVNSIYILNEKDMSITKRFKRNLLKTLIVSNKDCNIIVLHFSEGDDLLIEIFRRTELLYYFKELYDSKQLGKLQLLYSDSFKVRKNNLCMNFVINKFSNYRSSPNFDDAQKMDYLEKWGKFFLKGSFKEKLVVLTDIGLMYFDEPVRTPKRIIKIVGSEIHCLHEKVYNKKFVFQIDTINQGKFVFRAKSEESMNNWIREFQIHKKKNEEKKLKILENRI